MKINSSLSVFPPTFSLWDTVQFCPLPLLFACTHHLNESGRSASPTAASFIRPSRPSDQPRSFYEALKKKYASSSAEDIAATANEIHISGKTVEEVGFEKIRRQLAELQELRIVVLDGACIATIDSDLGEQNLKIIELDLSRNLFESWNDVTAMCSSLQSLQRLRLEYARYIFSGSRPLCLHWSCSGNTLSRPQDSFENDQTYTSYRRLKELSLNNLCFLQHRTTGRYGDLSRKFVSSLFFSITFQH